MRRADSSSCLYHVEFDAEAINELIRQLVIESTTAKQCIQFLEEPRDENLQRRALPTSMARLPRWPRSTRVKRRWCSAGKSPARTATDGCPSMPSIAATASMFG